MRDTPSAEDAEAKLVYGPGAFQVVRPGAYVVCAVTGVRIPLEDLRYWSLELQEPYVDAVAASRRHAEKFGRP